MKRPAIALALFFFGTIPLFAQQTTTSEFGLMIGGSKRQSGGDDLTKNFSFNNTVKEVYYAVQLEPDTRFKIKAGEMETPVADGGSGHERVQHVAGIIDYRFSESFGETGLFAGAGMYRQKRADGNDATDYGFQGGINGDFPLTRRFGIVVEGTYHWVHFERTATFITATAGLRISF